jgi:hypothetical protein
VYIEPAFVDASLSASLLGDELEDRRNQLHAMLPIRRVVGPADVAAQLKKTELQSGAYGSGGCSAPGNVRGQKPVSG